MKNLIKIEKSIHRKDNFCSCFYNSFVLALNSMYYLVSRWEGHWLIGYPLCSGKEKNPIGIFIILSSGNWKEEQKQFDSSKVLHPRASLFCLPPLLKWGIRWELPWAVSQKLRLSAISYPLDMKGVLWQQYGYKEDGKHSFLSTWDFFMCFYHWFRDRILTGIATKVDSNISKSITRDGFTQWLVPSSI